VSTKDPPNTRKRFLIPVLSVLLIVGLIEAVVVPLEILVPSEFRGRQTTLYGLFEPHPELGFRTRANLRDFEITWMQNSLRASYSTDERGFRNVGRDYGQSEIFFVGDSFTWGMWLPRGQTFPDLVGQRLGKPVSNLGQQSYYIEQYEKILRGLLGRYSPRYVALCIFANDLTTPISDDDLANFYERFGWDQYRQYSLYKKFFVYQASQFIGRQWRRLAIATGLEPPPAPSHLDHETNQAGMEFYRQLGAHPYYFTQSYDAGVEAVFRRLLVFVQQSEVTPVVFLLPSKESAYKREYLKIFPSDYLEIEETAYRRLCELSTDLGVDCVDLTSAFRQASATRETYFKRDPHWNRDGHLAAAGEMLKYFEKTAESSPPE
jgi:hypothetical protein